MSESIRKGVEILKNQNFFRFDSFLIEKMLGMPSDILTEKDGDVSEIRKKAYQMFCKALGKKRTEIAAIQTIQKWFGIRNYTVPDRETVFQICFALHLSEKEVSEYLTKGIREPDFQINDYRETIFLYCFHNGMDYEAALRLIEDLERRIPLDITLNQHNNTNDLVRDYYVNCDLERDEFFAWMLERAEEFKGYSMTALEYFKLLKSEILLEVKEDAQRELDEHLKATDFYEWEKARHLSVKKRRKHIPRYVRFASDRKENCLSETEAEHILELCEMSYININSNSELLVQLFDNVSTRIRNYKTNNRGKLKKSRFPININLMNDKRLSDMLNVMIHRDRLIHYSLAACRLEQMDDRQECPENIKKILLEYRCDNEECQTVGTALAWLKKQKINEKRRCVLIQRNDILPMVQCVAIKRYSKQLGESEDYVATEAREGFVRQANLILASCHMEPLNAEKYEMDAALFQCYQEDDYYYFADVLEALGEEVDLPEE